MEKYKNNMKVKYKTETHHIIPKSMGGGNDKENLVNLPIKVHYICHHLLIYMVSYKEDNIKMIHAFWRMTNTTKQKQKITAKQYELLKNKRHIHMSDVSKKTWTGRKHTEKSKFKMSESAKGRNPHLYENYKLPKIWNKGKTKENDDKIKKMSEHRKGSNNPMYGTTGKNNPKAKRFDLCDNNSNILGIFFTRKEFELFCKENKMPFSPLYKTLKTDIKYIDNTKHQKYKKFNGFKATYF